MDPLVEQLVKQYGMSPDIAGRVAMNLRGAGNGAGYEGALQAAGMPTSPNPAGVDAVSGAGGFAGVSSVAGSPVAGMDDGRVATTSAAIAQQFGIAPDQAARLAARLHNAPAIKTTAQVATAMPDVAAGMQVGQRHRLLLEQRDRMHQPTLEVGRATTQRVPDVSLKVGKATVSKGQPELKVGKAKVAPVTMPTVDSTVERWVAQKRAEYEAQGHPPEQLDAWDELNRKRYTAFLQATKKAK